MRKLFTALILFFAVLKLLASQVHLELDTFKHIAIMDSAIKGKAYVFSDEKGNVRWQTALPFESVMISNERGVFQFEKQNGKWRKLDAKFGSTVKRVVDEIRRIVVGNFGDAYDIEKSVDSLVLIPKNSATKTFISKIVVLLRKDSQVPQSIEFIEVSGDKTIMNVVNFSENTTYPFVFDETKIEEFICPQK